MIASNDNIPMAYRINDDGEFDYDYYDKLDELMDEPSDDDFINDDCDDIDDDYEEAA
ncbi:hypothetical protein O9X81_00220 [Agrobacterium salinitolerans]|uniref:hypothetical protein n=1 Tax=Agrobacterium salinitolerans TaxID=1183413 RepID=UPI0022B80D8A|nr:hypothetical protein [Agrobacterium salinitolerans]MCZ7855033.1 hypothetical protein [Agrobacterium salinitolerans]